MSENGEYTTLSPPKGVLSQLVLQNIGRLFGENLQ